MRSSFGKSAVYFGKCGGHGYGNILGGTAFAAGERDRGAILDLGGCGLSPLHTCGSKASVQTVPANRKVSVKFFKETQIVSRFRLIPGQFYQFISRNPFIIGCFTLLQNDTFLIRIRNAKILHKKRFMPVVEHSPYFYQVIGSNSRFFTEFSGGTGYRIFAL